MLDAPGAFRRSSASACRHHTRQGVDGSRGNKIEAMAHQRFAPLPGSLRLPEELLWRLLLEALPLRPLHPQPLAQTAIGSCPFTGSVSSRAIALGTWISRYSSAGPINSSV